MARELAAPLVPTAGSVRRGSRPARILLPELSNLWIRYAPRLGRDARRWPGPDAPWLDLSRGGRLVWDAAAEDGAADLPPLPEGPLDDVLYLPPVAEDHRPALDAVARAHLEHGTPVLAQRLPGDPPPPAGAVTVWDPTALLLTGSEAELVPALEDSFTGGSPVLLWPLIAGAQDDPARLERLLDGLGEGGKDLQGAVVHPLPLPLDPADRRRLLEVAGRGENQDEESTLFHRLFHGSRPDPREACRRVASRGLAPWLERPLPRPPLPGAAARRAVGWLALAAELHHRAGRPAAAHRGFLAARMADQSRDLVAMGRDGHLEMLDGVGPEERELLQQALTGKPPGLIALEEEYLSNDPPDIEAPQSRGDENES